VLRPGGRTFSALPPWEKKKKKVGKAAKKYFLEKIGWLCKKKNKFSPTGRERTPPKKGGRKNRRKRGKGGENCQAQRKKKHGGKNQRPPFTEVKKGESKTEE